MLARTEERIQRLPEVSTRIGYKRSHIYRLINRGILPMPIKLAGGKAIGWPASVIDKFLADQISAQ